MADLVKQVLSLPDNAELWLQVKEPHYQGHNWVSTSSYGFFIDTKSLKSLTKAAIRNRMSRWEKIKDVLGI